MQINMSLKKTEFSMNYMVYGLEYIDILDNNIILFYMQINELYKDRIFNDLHVLWIGIHYLQNIISFHMQINMSFKNYKNFQ